MNHPSLFRRVNRWAIGSVACLVLIALVLAVVNAIDCAPYGLALRRANKLKAEDLTALAVACTRYEKGGHSIAVSSDLLVRMKWRLLPIVYGPNP